MLDVIVLSPEHCLSIYFNIRNKVLTANFSNKAIDILNIVGRFQNFIGGILT